MWPGSSERAGWPVGYRDFRIIKGSTSKVVLIAMTVALGGMLSVNGRNLVTCGVTWTELRLNVENVLINKSQCTSKRRSQLVVRPKAIENAMRFCLLLFFQPLLLTSDLLTNQEVTRSKEVTLSGSNELAVLVGSSQVGLRVMVFWGELNSWLGRITRMKLCAVSDDLTTWPRHYKLYTF